VTSRDERLARNESLFREVNERISEVNAAFDVDGRADYLCECGRPNCTEAISLTHGEYERVRAVPTHFLVKPGHEDPSVERVVQQNDGYFVVEKLGEAADEAAAFDPRS
jgi:hypothetical protein